MVKDFKVPLKNTDELHVDFQAARIRLVNKKVAKAFERGGDLPWLHTGEPKEEPVETVPSKRASSESYVPPRGKRTYGSPQLEEWKQMLEDLKADRNDEREEVKRYMKECEDLVASSNRHLQQRFNELKERVDRSGPTSEFTGREAIMHPERYVSGVTSSSWNTKPKHKKALDNVHDYLTGKDKIFPKWETIFQAMKEPRSFDHDSNQDISKALLFLQRQLIEMSQKMKPGDFQRMSLVLNNHLNMIQKLPTENSDHNKIILEQYAQEVDREGLSALTLSILTNGRSTLQVSSKILSKLSRHNVGKYQYQNNGKSN